MIGAGPAGLAAAVTAAERGHTVTLYDADDKIGGQFNLAKKIPGKEEFNETLRYYQYQLNSFGVELKLNQRISAADLNNYEFDEVIVATGIKPRIPEIDGINHPSVVGYVDVITGKIKIGERVAIIGAGGIGFDTAEYLSHAGEPTSQNISAFMHEWGIDMKMNARAGVEGIEAKVAPCPRNIYLCQRKPEGIGKSLGKTTGWIHRIGLMKKGIKMLAGCQYMRIDDEGLHLLVNNDPRALKVDNVVVCAGQEPLREITEELNKPFHLIGGADVAVELDAKRAIDQATRLAAEL